MQHIKIVKKGVGKNKTVALTFDDGPNPYITPKILKILDDNCVKASFFVIGKWVDKYPEIVTELIANGHTVGAHSQLHSFYKNENDMCSDMINGIKSVEECTGSKIKFIRFPRLRYRPLEKIKLPNPSIETTRLFKMINKGRINVIDCNINTHDWDLRVSDQEVIDSILNNVAPSSIILMHDGSEIKEELKTRSKRILRILPKVIVQLKKDNYKFVTLDDMDLMIEEKVFYKKNRQINFDRAKKGLFVDVSKQILSKKNMYKGLNPDDTAKKFWKHTINNKSVIDKAQNDRCRVSILIPVMNERVIDIKKQIQSILGQLDVNLKEFEIIYLINNDLHTKTKEGWEKILNSNQKVLRYLNSLKNDNIFVIDRSSKGKEIQNCNIGKSRNILIAEASFRYFKNKKNGILIHIDADTRFQDPYFIRKVLDRLLDKKIIGVAGGLILESSANQNSIMGKKLRLYVLYRKWKTVINYINDKNTRTYIDDDSFYGANMISRSLESAQVGGVIDANAEEDTQFGNELKEYARKFKKTIIGCRDSLRVTAKFRPSNRTDASIKKYLDLIRPDSEILVYEENKLNNKPYILSEKEFDILKQKMVYKKDCKAVLKYIKNNLDNITFKK